MNWRDALAPFDVEGYRALKAERDGLLAERDEALDILREWHFEGTYEQLLDRRDALLARYRRSYEQARP